MNKKLIIKIILIINIGGLLLSLLFGMLNILLEFPYTYQMYNVDFFRYVLVTNVTTFFLAMIIHITTGIFNDKENS